MNERKVIQVFLNPEPIYPGASFLICKFSVPTKVLKIKFLKQIYPTTDHFQDIGAIKKVICIFLKKVIPTKILISTLYRHK